MAFTSPLSKKEGDEKGVIYVNIYQSPLLYQERRRRDQHTIITHPWHQDPPEGPIRRQKDDAEAQKTALRHVSEKESDGVCLNSSARLCSRQGLHLAASNLPSTGYSALNSCGITSSGFNYPDCQMTKKVLLLFLVVDMEEKRRKALGKNGRREKKIKLVIGDWLRCRQGVATRSLVSLLFSVK